MPGSPTRYGPYEIVAPLGAGGMGEVYRAHDPRLRRDVAIKLLPPHRSDDPESIARMVRESRLVAALDHPAILTIHDVGEEHGRFYFVTELLDGETLRERLKRGPLTTREALEFARPIAAALAGAHARGIVHRDLKPENVMSTAAGTVKVLDFGVAKVVSAPETETAVPATFVTDVPSHIGTPAYMAPEQLDGRLVDHRTDQFAFGVLLYEMLAGQRPFKGATVPEISASILRDDPVHLSAVRPDVPGPVARVVARCLAKDPNERFASTTDLAHAITDVQADRASAGSAAPVSPRRRSAAWWGVVAALVALVVLAITFGWPNERASVPSRAGTTVAPAVVVLPFTTIGSDETYLSDGITEAVTRELGHIEGTRVIAANSAFAYRDRTEGLAQIGRELGADLLLRGSVQRAADRLGISATLVSAVDNTTLWSARYDRGTGDILAVQDDIAWQVAAKLAASLGRPAPARPTFTPRTTPAAYDAFLRGLDYMRGRSSTFAQGIVELERAVALDPTFALARARLASAYTQQFFYNASDPALEQKAFVEIQQALAINPDLAEAYLARAQLTWNLRNGFPHDRAIADVRRAIANNPSLAEAHVELGKLYLHIGLIDKAIAANEEALRLDPRTTLAIQRLIGAKIDGRRAGLGDELARNPQWSLRSRSTVLSYLERTDEAIAAILPHGPAIEEIKKLDMNEAALLSQLFARNHQRANAERTLTIAIPLAANPTGLSDTHHAQFAIGCAYALLGDSDKALEWTTKAANEGYPSYPRFSSEPDLKSLSAHPGFVKLLARLRQDHERWRTSL